MRPHKMIRKKLPDGTGLLEELPQRARGAAPEDERADVRVQGSNARRAAAAAAAQTPLLQQEFKVALWSLLPQSTP